MAFRCSGAVLVLGVVAFGGASLGQNTPRTEPQKIQNWIDDGGAGIDPDPGDFVLHLTAKAVDGGVRATGSVENRGSTPMPVSLDFPGVPLVVGTECHPGPDGAWCEVGANVYIDPGQSQAFTYLVPDYLQPRLTVTARNAWLYDEKTPADNTVTATVTSSDTAIDSVETGG
jgi:hypothetical protein